MIAYKYRGGYNFDRDLDSVAGDYFYASGLDKLNDPFEATYSIEPMEKFMEFVELVVGRDPNMLEVKKSLHDVIGNLAKVGIFSLAARPDDLKLWSHYASNHTGFCVGYEVERLEKFNSKSHYTHYLVEVKYSEEPATLDFTDVIGKDIKSFLQKTIGTKHPDWSHEAETRVVTDKEGRMPHDFRAVKSIYFGLHMLQSQIDEVMQRMQGRGIAYYKMQRNATAYGLRAEPLADAFTGAPLYLYKIGPVAENAVDTYAKGKEKQQLLPYLKKAVEIQRRDPYCSEVQYAERCLGKDRVGQIYVSYQYEGSYYNRYLTKLEIDDLYAQITDLDSL